MAAPLPLKRARTALVIAGAWTGVAAVLSLQGYLMGLYGGSPQPWWPSFRYSLAIVSVWAVLTPFILDAVADGRRDRRALPLLARLVFGFAVVCVAHVVLFSLVYWPLYGAGQHDTLWAMGRHMLVRNIGQNVLFYGGLVILGRRRTPTAPAAPSEVLKVRRRGGFLLVPLDTIRWLRAAGNYAEAMTDQGPLLLDESLADLEKRLPPARYARVHRAAIVRLNLIREVRSRGHGDADLVLNDGDVVRLSRRYRKNLAAVVPA